jgi:GR25 family glycosyltransferase involved in LPS biosynthesis
MTDTNIPRILQHAFFINLDERPDRLVHIKGELQKIGLEDVAQRVKGCRVSSGGGLGCTLSHIKCLENAKENDYETIFIMEDDITFLDPTLLVKNIRRFEDTNPDWDVLVIGGNVCPPYLQMNDFSIRISNVQTTTGYIVRRHYYDTMIQNFRESVEKLMKEPHLVRLYALDIYWKTLQKTGNWYMIIPPTVIQYENFSDIEMRNVNYKFLMLDLEKKWLV